MKRKLNKLFAISALVLSFALFSTEAYSQCAMCRATVESNVGTGSKKAESEVGSGLNTGILYLMVVPYLLIGTVGFLWYKSNKKKKSGGA